MELPWAAAMVVDDLACVVIIGVDFQLYHNALIVLRDESCRWGRHACPWGSRRLPPTLRRSTGNCRPSSTGAAVAT